MTCARSLRWMVSVWTPKNRIRPRINTSSPMMPSRCAAGLPYYPRIILGAWCAMQTSSRLLRLLCQIAVVDIADRDRPPGQRTAQSGRELERRAACERGIDRFQIGPAGICRGAGRGIGHAWGGDDFARALETEANRHLHARPRDVGRRRRPAGPQRRKQVADGVEIVVRLAVF